jgi:hypothetical protein
MLVSLVLDVKGTPILRLAGPRGKDYRALEGVIWPDCAFAAARAFCLPTAESGRESPVGISAAEGFA